MKIEKGVMVMKDGKAWGIENGQEGEEYAWVAIEDAKIFDPKYYTKTTSVPRFGCVDIKELKSAKLVAVTRTTTVEIDGAA